MKQIRISDIDHRRLKILAAKHGLNLPETIAGLLELAESLDDSALEGAFFPEGELVGGEEAQ